MPPESIDIFDLWSGLDSRHLAAFQAVARTGSVARAADRLGYTQPAVSHQLATLERLVGARLVDRGSGRGRAALTPAGELFATHVQALERQLASARADLAALADAERAGIRVGAFQSVSARILPALVQRLAAADPAVRLELTESTDEVEPLVALADGRLDFAFALLPLEDPAYEAVELLRDPFCLVGAVGGAYRVDIGSLRELASVPLIAPRTCRSWTAILEQLRAAGVEPTYAYRTNDNLAIKGLVQSGMGVAFLSRLTLQGMDEGLAIAPADELVAPRRIGLAWMAARELLPHQQLLLALAREVCAAVAPGRRNPPSATRAPADTTA